MAVYRNVQMSFWTDSKVADDFTPEDKYFYLYLFTNPHTNLCGCYEISIKLIANETGYSKDTIERLIERFEKFHKVISYSKESKEILLLNWHKYNWTKSEKFLSGLDKSINEVKNEEFRHYLSEIRRGSDTVSIPYECGMDTTVTFSFSDTDSVTFLDTDKDSDINKVKSGGNSFNDGDIINDSRLAGVKDKYNKSHRLADGLQSAGSDLDKDLGKNLESKQKAGEEDKRSKMRKTESMLELFERLLPNYAISDALADKVREWLIYKTERKEIYKEQGMKSLLTQILKRAKQYGDIAMMELMDECMASNWAGIIWNMLEKQANGKRNNNLDEWRNA